MIRDRTEVQEIRTARLAEAKREFRERDVRYAPLANIILRARLIALNLPATEIQRIIEEEVPHA